MPYLNRIVVPAGRTSIDTRAGDTDLTTVMPGKDAFTVHSRFAGVIVPTLQEENTDLLMLLMPMMLND